MRTMIVSIDNSSDIGNIFTAVSQLRGVTDVALQENASSQIAGLSYSHQERMLDIHIAEADYANGNTITSQELLEKISLW